MKPVGNSSAEFAADLKEEDKRWAKVVKERHLSAN
jgi:hypothetical protein